LFIEVKEVKGVSELRSLWEVKGQYHSDAERMMSFSSCQNYRPLTSLTSLTSITLCISYHSGCKDPFLMKNEE
jgi:hypothetical protein